MTVAIKRQNGDLIWFDAVLSFQRQYGASVTKHPLESGAVVSDHTTKENPSMQISGVISDVDFNMNRPNITEADAQSYGITNKQFVNNSPVVDIPVITAGDNALTRLLPESVSQFLDEQAPTVIVTQADRPKYAAMIEADLSDMWSATEAFEVLDFKGNLLDKVYENCIITNLSFKEDADSGDALYPDISIEQVVYALTTNTTIPTNVSSSVKNKASPVVGKGNQSTTKTEADSPDAKTEKTGLSGKEAQDVKNNNMSELEKAATS